MFANSDDPSQRFKKSFEHMTGSWKNITDFMKSCQTNSKDEETRAFVDYAFPNVIRYLLNFHPQKVNELDRIFIANTLESGLKVCLSFIEQRRWSFLNAITDILDFRKVYYAGTQTPWSKLPGLPELRIRMIEKFNQQKGFQKLLTLFEGDMYQENDINEKTINSTNGKNIDQSIGNTSEKESMKRITSARLTVDQSTIILEALAIISGDEDLIDLKYRFCVSLMQHFSTFSEDELKQESTDHFFNFIFCLRQLLDGSGHVDDYCSFHLNLTLKFFCANSLPMRLFALQLIAEMIEFAQEKRPLARRFEVTGAGSPIVNGIYEISDLSSPTYTMETNNIKLTMFQCRMNGGEYEWFISEADERNPGTNSDHDYYRNNTFPNGSKQPALTGWRVSVSQPIYGINPPPVLSSLDLLIEPGKESELLENRLLEWIIHNNILKYVFGDSIHREMVNRSQNIVFFLNSMNRVNEEMVEMIWESCTRANELELVKEIFQLLTALLVDMKNENLKINLIKIIHQHMYNSDGGYGLVRNFLLYLCDSPIISQTWISNISSGLIEKLVTLIWDLIKNEEQEDGKHIEKITVFFKEILQASNSIQIVLRLWNQCKNMIQQSVSYSIENINNHSYEKDELNFENNLRMLKFLLSSLELKGFENIFAQEKDLQEFSNLMVNEIIAFWDRNNTLHLPNSSYEKGFKNRLAVFRHFHGLSAEPRLSFEILSLFWDKFNSPLERDHLMSFLSDAASNQQNLLPALTNDTCSRLFDSKICAGIDWENISFQSYESFHQIFEITNSRIFSRIKHYETLPLEIFIQGTNNTENSTSNGLDALWKIALLASNQNVSQSAQNDLLNIYYLENYDDLFVQGILFYLNEIQLGLLNLNPIFDCSKQINKSNRVIQRCLFLVQGAIQNSSGKMILSHHECSEFPIQFDLPSNQTFSSDNSINIIENSLSQTTKNDIENSLNVVQPSANSSQAHFGDKIATKPDLFKILLQLIDQSLVDFANVQQINDLLNCLPTPIYIKELICQKVYMNYSKQDITENNQQQDLAHFKSLFDENRWHHSVYIMETISELLHPHPKLNQGIEFTINFQQNFQQSGGFGIILELFENLLDFSLEKFSSISTGISAAMRILQACLLFNPSQTLDLSILVDKLMNAAVSIPNSFSDKSEPITFDRFEKFLLVTLSTVGFVLCRLDNINSIVESRIFQNFIDTILKNNTSPKVWRQLHLILQNRKEVAHSMFPVLLTHFLAVSINDSHPGVAIIEMLSQIVVNHTNQQNINQHSNYIDIHVLASALIQKLIGYTKIANVDELSEDLLLQLFQFFQKLFLSLSPSDVSILKSEVQNSNLLDIIIYQFLLRIPVQISPRDYPICQTASLRKVTFGLLQSIVQTDLELFIKVSQILTDFVVNSSNVIKYRWLVETSDESRDQSIQYVGLRNQGCTCYMNSLLQQIFMISEIRNAVITAKRNRPNELIKGEALVGKQIAVSFEYPNKPVSVSVLAYDVQTGMHSIRYHSGNLLGENEDIMLNLNEGRSGKELPGYTILDTEGQAIVSVLNGVEAISRAEENLLSKNFLDQLQRTFFHLIQSKRKYFDPRGFVEACRCLNLEYDVYQQNDASEFCDKLLDRLEISFRGSQNSKLLDYCFGGKTVTQKIPKDCSHRTERFEPFIRIELIIRGKESIEESLNAYIEGELMHGDNKVECEQCNQKKDTLRRTCIGTLPNVLILHLKRFDLDYNTFETVKLNSRCAFPMKLNMKNYTKEGIEAKESAEKLAKLRTENESEGKDDDTVQSVLDDTDYEYELTGILVHLGVAKGGHYYSLIRDKNSSNSNAWYKFDDSNISVFDSKDIENQCFGGNTTKTTQGRTTKFENLSNALMLFYQKVKPIRHELLSLQKHATIHQSQPTELIDGEHAHSKEVWQGNTVIWTQVLLVDEELSYFIHQLTQLVYSRTNESKLISNDINFNQSLFVPTHEAVQSVFELCVTYYFDVLLHSRQKQFPLLWLQTLNSIFSSSQTFCQWFLTKFCDINQTNWAKLYLLDCSDMRARQYISQLLVHVILSEAQFEAEQLDAFLAYANPIGNSTLKVAEMQSTNTFFEKYGRSNCIVLQFIEFLNVILCSAPLYWRHTDELFSLIKEIAIGNEALRQILLLNNFVAILGYFALGSKAPQVLHNTFQMSLVQDQLWFADSIPLLQAITAILGIPQANKVQLLDECSTDFNATKLSPEFHLVLVEIFRFHCKDEGMNGEDIQRYFQKCRNNQLFSMANVRMILQRFHNLPDGRLSLQGFLNFYRNLALTNPKQVWQDLFSLQYSSDLTKCSSLSSHSFESIFSIPESARLRVPELTSYVLTSELFYYEFRMAHTQILHKIAIRVCKDNFDYSQMIIKNAISNFALSIGGTAAEHLLEAVLILLYHMLTIRDNYQIQRLKLIISTLEALKNLEPISRDATYRSSCADQALKILVDNLKKNRILPINSSTLNVLPNFDDAEIDRDDRMFEDDDDDENSDIDEDNGVPHVYL